MHEEILEFINRRWRKDADWCSGNCWYFVSILMERFSNLGRYYFPVEGHFVAGDGKRFYDWNGIFASKYPYYDWNYLRQADPKWAARLLRDCLD